MELLDKLKQRLIADLRRQPDGPYISSGERTWTKDEMIQEVENMTDQGVNLMSGVIMLTIDLIARQKRSIDKIGPIRWRGTTDRMFGEVGKLTLFYIKDRKIGGGLLKYELEVKFLDRRWDSDSIEELQNMALEQLHILATEITK